MGKSVKTPRTRTTSVPELAAFAGVSRHTIYEWAKLPGYPKADDGSVALWDLCEWRLSYTSGRDDDLDLSGFDSPNLERLRAAKADEAELKLAIMRGRYVSTEKVNALRMREGQMLGNCIEQLDRSGNSEAADLLRDTWTEYGKETLGEDDLSH